MSTPITVVAIVAGTPATAQAVEAAIRACVPPTRAEAGCRSYVAHRDLKTAGQYVFVESWESQAALDAHMQTPHLKALGAAMKANDVPLQVMTLQALED